MATQEFLNQLVAAPSESANVELKEWLDLDQASHVAKLVKAIFALRNYNGGYVAIGFENTTMTSVDCPYPDVAEAYHPDRIQGFVSKYASEPFSVDVHFVRSGHRIHPVVEIHPGVRTPVAVKKVLQNVQGGKTLLDIGDVLFRTLGHNNVMSSAKAAPSDWSQIIGICHDNREADIGRFIRRQLGDPNVLAVLSQLNIPLAAPPSLSLKDKSEEILRRGDERFQKRLKEDGIVHEETLMLGWGAFEVAATIDGGVTGFTHDRNFYNLLASNNPRYSGWPAWLDATVLPSSTHKPRSMAGAWETYISIHDESRWYHFEFYRIEPSGNLFMRRLIDDDGSARVNARRPLTTFEPSMAVRGVTETIATASSFAVAMGASDRMIGFSFRWTKLKQRHLSGWSAQLRVAPNAHQSHEDSYLTYIEIPADTPHTALAPYIEEIVGGLFALFDGFTMPSASIERLVNSVVNRRSN